MQERTIDNALLAIHKAGGEQADLARQLLRMRGIEPPIVLPRCSDAFRRGQMRRAIFAALRDGPMTGPDIVRHVMRYKNSWTFKDTQKRVATTLTKLKDAGLVRREGRLWLAR